MTWLLRPDEAPSSKPVPPQPWVRSARERAASVSGTTRHTRCACGAAAAATTSRSTPAAPAATPRHGNGHVRGPAAEAPPPCPAACARELTVAALGRLALQTTGVRRPSGARRLAPVAAATSRPCHASSRTAFARVRTRRWRRLDLAAWSLGAWRRLTRGQPAAAICALSEGLCPRRGAPLSWRWAARERREPGRRVLRALGLFPIRASVDAC